MKTVSANANDVERRWYVVDAREQVLGRLSSEIAKVLRGKHKPTFTPHADTGDFVIVINAKDVRLTGRKWQNKLYIRHTGWVGGIKTETAETVREKAPERLIQSAVKGMLPRGPLGRTMLRKLKVYAGEAHPHEAQMPKTLNLVTRREGEA